MIPKRKGRHPLQKQFTEQSCVRYVFKENFEDYFVFKILVPDLEKKKKLSKGKGK